MLVLGLAIAWPRTLLNLLIGVGMLLSLMQITIIFLDRVAAMELDMACADINGERPQQDQHSRQ